MASITFYAPTCIDMSMTFPDKRGVQKPTGDLSALIFTRTFTSTGKGNNIKASRGIVSISWKKDKPEAKAEAFAKAVHGLEELEGLDRNPPVSWIPQIVKEKLQ